MSRKILLLSGGGALLLVNALIIGILYFAGVIFQPTAEELEAQRLAEEEARIAAENAIKYAHLEPLPEFKSKAKYVPSMGKAVDICEETLHEKEKSRKSWAVNFIESRYISATDIYMIFLDYETIVGRGEEPKIMKVTCEVEAETKNVVNWKAMKAE